MNEDKQDNRRRCIWLPDDIWLEIKAAAGLEGRTASGWLRVQAKKALARRKAVQRVTGAGDKSGAAFRVRA